LNKANNQGTGTNNTRRFGRANWGTLPFHIPRAKENKTVRLNKILPNKKNANLIYFRGLSARSKHKSKSTRCPNHQHPHSLLPEFSVDKW